MTVETLNYIQAVLEDAPWSTEIIEGEVLTTRLIDEHDDLYAEQCASLPPLD